MTIAAGIDIGTSTIKAALFKVENGEEVWLSRQLMRIRQRDPLELARVVYDAGPGQNLRRLAVWLEEQDRLGRLSTPDPVAAAEMFTGMVLGHGHLRSVLGLPHPEIDDIPARAREAACRFVRAFAPQ